MNATQWAMEIPSIPKVFPERIQWKCQVELEKIKKKRKAEQVSIARDQKTRILKVNYIYNIFLIIKKYIIPCD